MLANPHPVAGHVGDKQYSKQDCLIEHLKLDDSDPDAWKELAKESGGAKRDVRSTLVSTLGCLAHVQIRLDQLQTP